MSGTTSYNNDKVVTGEVEYPATDPASGAFFHTDFKKNEDLKLMLDGSKDSLKLEAMKRIIGMIAKGRDASDLFPAVVKNVVSKNIEVKKLVYVYLVRYAEEQQDLALLSISTFQRALKDPNQLIRASALRVLSSIRVPMIVPIVMLAIRDSASDMSPYVRKTAAHAIPKLYSLDPEQKEELVQVIDRLLSDKAPLVVGSAAMAFSEVCPDRMTLIHRSYRKLCSLLADVDEWGQLTLLNVLTVYARTCFPDPNCESYSSDSDTDTDKPADSDSELGWSSTKQSNSPSIEADHRLLLRAAKPLLQSRNAGVVVAVAQLFCHAAPVQELSPVAKALVRLLRAPAEVQSVVLTCIAALTVTRPTLFQPFLKSFFVRNSDPTHIKLLKLEIVSNIATESNAGVVLRELQTYVSVCDSTFVAATVHAIGRLASNIHTHTQPCLSQLLKLLSSKDERVVCEAVVVVKRVVGGGAAPAAAAVARALRLLHADRLAGAARAAALWLVAEHGATHPLAAAALAHMAQNFADQEELVKLQILSLAVKLSITQPDTLPMCRYIVLLARYDVSYDVRDRARALRKFIEPHDGKLLTAYAREIFCPEKPKPIYTSSFKDREQYTVGSLSQYIGTAANGYRPLPISPPTAVPSSLRDPPVTEEVLSVKNNTQEQKNKSFYSEPGSSGSGSSSASESSSEEESSDGEQPDKKTEKTEDTKNGRSSTSDSESDSASSESSESEGSSEESSDDEADTNVREVKTTDNDDKKPPQETTNYKNKPSPRSNLELLLELDAEASSLPTMTPTLGGMLSPENNTILEDTITPVGPALVPRPGLELLASVVSGGLAAKHSWARSPHLYSRTMAAVSIEFTNNTANSVCNIRIGKKTLSGSRSMHDFATIPTLPPGGTISTILGVDFADTIQPVEFTIASSLGEVPVSITPPVGELMRAVTMSVNKWDTEQKKLRGMTECDKMSVKLSDEAAICKKVFETANLAAINNTGELLRFAGRMLTSQDLVLLSVKIDSDSTRVVANCQNMAIASLLANDVAQAFTRG